MMSKLKPEDKKLLEALNEAMKDENFYDTILEATQAKRIQQLQDLLEAYATVHSPTNPLWLKNKQLKVENKKLKEVISITLSELENRVMGIDLAMIERRLEQSDSDA